MKIALGVSGGIACYKSAEIVRRLQDRGVDVVVLMTKNATQFVTPLTFRALSGNKVYVDLFEGPSSGSDFEGAFDHILIAQSIDLFLIAPATADCIARLAAGLANLKTLVGRGVHIIQPEIGQMACRTYGPGRLAPVKEIVDCVMSLLNRRRDLEGRKVLVTAGPTIEDIDPVRYISNRSSGKMGFAIAHAARNRGAQVVLVSGPTGLDFPDTNRVRTTEEMRRAVVENVADADAVIKAAAPLDFRPKSVAAQKIKKKTANLVLDLKP